jgi:glycine/D-amino acid oxidase-like deaminating enzyme
MDWARRSMMRLFPQLGDVAFDHGWFGKIGMTDDAMPRLHVHDRNMVSISGHNGRGIAPGTSFGRELARLASGEIEIDALPVPLTEQRAAPLRGLKGAFYEAGAQLAHLAGS